MKVLHALFCLLLSITLSFGLKNPEAEHQCQKFLTSHTTAPISPHAIRNLAIDVEAESWCRLVLEDGDLPLEIRGVVLEGLVHLLMTHTAGGLSDRRSDAYELHQELVMKFPESPRFLLQAADYAARVMGKPDEAISALENRLWSVDKESDQDKAEAEAAERLLTTLKQNQLQARAPEL